MRLNETAFAIGAPMKPSRSGAGPHTASHERRPPTGRCRAGQQTEQPVQQRVERRHNKHDVRRDREAALGLEVAAADRVERVRGQAQRHPAQVEPRERGDLGLLLEREQQRLGVEPDRQDRLGLSVSGCG
jgi:hypothetical protein